MTITNIFGDRKVENGRGGLGRTGLRRSKGGGTREEEQGTRGKEGEGEGGVLT